MNNFDELRTNVSDCMAIAIDMTGPLVEPSYRDELSLQLLQGLRLIQLNLGNLEAASSETASRSKV